MIVCIHCDISLPSEWVLHLKDQHGIEATARQVSDSLTWLRDTLRTKAELTWLQYNHGTPGGYTHRRLENILSRRTQALGVDDPDTILSKSGLGWFFMYQKNYETALHHLKEALEARKRILGYQHLKTVDSMIAVARCLNDMGAENIELIKVFEEAVDAAKTVLAPGHPDKKYAVERLKYLRNIVPKMEESRSITQA